MSLDTIPTRANGTEIDLTWFNILQAVLGTDFVPRSSGGVVTDQAGGLGNSTYAWLAAYLMTLKLRAATSGNLATLKAIDTLAANLTIILPATLPSAKSYMTIDNTGQMGFGGSSAIQTGASSGTLFLANGSSMTDVCSTTITTNGGPVLVMLVPDRTGDAFVSAATSSSSASNWQYNWNIDGTDVMTQPMQAPAISGGGTINYPIGGFSFIDPSPSAGSHTYKMRCSTGSTCALSLYRLKLAAKEL